VGADVLAGFMHPHSNSPIAHRDMQGQCSLRA
jgi:hypothetical protein